ncbi:hypothetical protein V8E36_005590 [Tilletia maclaganii]
MRGPADADSLPPLLRPPPANIRQVFALIIFANPPGAPAVPLVGAWELSSFGFLQRGTVQDVMAFMSKVSPQLELAATLSALASAFPLRADPLSTPAPSQTVAERTPPTQRQSVQENSYVAHVHARPASDGIVGVIVTDTEYPTRVVFSLLNKVLDEFVLKVPKTSYSSQVSAITTGSQAAPTGKGTLLASDSVFPQAQDYLKRYQDPRQADTIMKVQQELDETKIVLHKTIDSVLQRGEDLDKLVEKSATLSSSSKQFYKTAKKQNSCCVVM